MIISANGKPELAEFQALMQRTDQLLNEDAQIRPQYYTSRNGSLLEDAVKDALEECAVGTPFAGTIEKVSGFKFPDIVAAKCYGVEVKSTKDDHWTSTGSSILETTRISDVERIYMTFGKLGGAYPEFRSKPYEECLHGIAVTHMPRYLIDMRLKPGETIFDKMGIPYDQLRSMDNPIAPVSKYYRSLLRPGESLWWAGDHADEAVSAKIRLWSNVSTDEKKDYLSYGLAHYPEIAGGHYERYALWLTSQGVVDPHIRDQFSAGGQELMDMPDGTQLRFPGVYRRIKYYRSRILQHITGEAAGEGVYGPAMTKLVLTWCEDVSKAAAMSDDASMDALCMVFFGRSAADVRNAVALHPGLLPPSG